MLRFLAVILAAAIYILFRDCYVFWQLFWRQLYIYFLEIATFSRSYFGGNYIYILSRDCCVFWQLFWRQLYIYFLEIATFSGSYFGGNYIYFLEIATFSRSYFGGNHIYILSRDCYVFWQLLWRQLYIYTF